MSPGNSTENPTRGSALARELDRIPLPVRRRLGLPDIAVPLMDAAVLIVRELLDDHDDRPLQDRLAGIGSRLESVLNATADDAVLQRFTAWIESDFRADLERWLSQLRSPAGRLFWNRLLGTNRFNQLKEALAEDGALLFLGMRRMLRYCLPIAQAIADASNSLPPSARSEFEGLSFSEFTLVHVSLQLDEALDSYFAKRGVQLEKLDLPFRPDETRLLGLEVDELIARLRATLSEEAQLRADDLSHRLGRKLRGFEQVLDTSEDGASQAATSLVEFIDRLLREAFDDDYVVAWVDEHFPNDKRMVYYPNGSEKRRPTKRAQAFCFVMAGQKPNETDSLTPLMAICLVEARNSAQKIKHADEGTADERELLRDLMRSVRGAITFIMRFGWVLAADDRLEYLRNRFARAA